MAIRLKEPTLTEPFDYISRQDDALDTEREDFEEEWKRYQDGAGPPPLKDGHEPTVWRLKPITDTTLKAKLSDVVSEDGPNTAAVGYASYGLDGVKGLKNADGSPFKLNFERVDGYRRVRLQQLAQLPLDLLVELGLKVFQHDSPN